MTINEMCADLVAEHDALDAIVAPLDDARWQAATPSPGWSVSDQIAHLAYFDRTATLAIADPPAFEQARNELFAAVGEGVAAVDALVAGDATSLPAAEQLERWRDGRRELAEAASTLGEKQRVEWYGPSMGAMSFLTARLMETWAHGQDICDAVGQQRPATDRLRHIAQLGFITRGWSYVVRGEEKPDVPVRVELAAPSGATWSWGSDDAEQSVVGDALDFCLVVTQRRHHADTSLVVTGDAAIDWMGKAQAFAGGPTIGPAQGAFA